MRGEAQSLEALLEVLSQRIDDSRSELTTMSQNLMQLGDDATGKLGGITRELDSSTEKLRRHGEALDRAAERKLAEMRKQPDRSQPPSFSCAAARRYLARARSCTS